jgi:hypothetical protein
MLEDYHPGRSFRRGAITRATISGVKEDGIDFCADGIQGAI